MNEQRRRNEMVVGALHMVAYRAHEIHKTLPVNVDKQDLEQSGVLGLIDASERFDESRGIPFTQFAKLRVHGAMIDWLRTQDPVSRDTRKLQKKLERSRAALRAELMREPLDSEVAQHAGINISKYEDLALVIVSAPLQFTELQGGKIVEPADDAPQVDAAEKAQLGAILAEEIAKLPPRWQRAVHLRFNLDMTMLNIGKKMGVNESRISQILRLSMDRLRAQLAERGITSAKALSIQ